MGNDDDSERSRSRGKGSDRDRDRERQREKGSARDRDIERDSSAVTEERRRSGTGRRRNDEDDEAPKRRRSDSPSDRHARLDKPKLKTRSPSSDTRPKSRSRRDDERPSSREDDHGNGRENDRGNDVDDSVSKMQAAEEALQAKQKDKPSFELSGKLAAETNRVRGVTLLFSEPPEAAQPTTRWRLYVFKNGEALNEPLYIHRQSCYLFGRERRVADIPTDHPSCSKQHAVLQYRKVEKEKPDGMLSKQVRPYIMDLGSTNKTFINDAPIEAQRYYELREQDTLKFGNSSREYVLLHENSAA